MQIIPIKTRIIKPPKDNIYDIIDKILPLLKEDDIFIITSKIISIYQGRCLPIKQISTKAKKNKLIKSEADLYIAKKKYPGKKKILSIINNMIISSAGIDKSNGNGYCVLQPKNPTLEAKKICQYIKKKTSIKKIAVIITDSHSTPLRYGAIGISIGFYGLNPLRRYKGTKDIFNRKMKIERTNIVDSLAAAAVFSMGEGKEKRPIAIIRGAKIKFIPKNLSRNLYINDIKKDIFYPLLKNFKKNN